MKTRVLTSALSLLAAGAFAQGSPITITASDMPVLNDTLRWSAAATTGITTSQTGANQTWNFSALTSLTQGVDAYKSAAQVNPIYALTISTTAYGYKVADSIPGMSQLGGISVSNVYTFFNKKPLVSPNRYVAEGFAATVAGLPAPAAYTQEDTIYRFPLTFNSTASGTFYLSASVGGLGSLKMSGTRQTTVDGWGTIQTPFTTSAVPCIRVRSEVVEIDTVVAGGQAFPPIPRTTVEYRWLATGQHYPLMWITASKVAGTETVTAVRYRDTKREAPVSVANTPTIRELAVSPNPAAGGDAMLQLPASWTAYTVAVFDVLGRRVYEAANNALLPARSWPAGAYLVQVLHGTELGLVRLTK